MPPASFLSPPLASLDAQIDRAIRAWDDVDNARSYRPGGTAPDAETARLSDRAPAVSGLADADAGPIDIDDLEPGSLFDPILREDG